MKGNSAQGKPSWVIALVEDSRTKMLLRRYLILSGVRPDQWRFVPQGKWSGSGEQAVRLNYAEQVQAFRIRSAGKQSKTSLMVAIDADTGTVQDRLSQLAAALKESGQAPIDTGTECIAHLVPKKNIETWILCLNGEAVGEEKSYKAERNYREAEWNEKTRLASEALFQWTRSMDDLPAHCVES